MPANMMSSAYKGSFFDPTSMTASTQSVSPYQQQSAYQQQYGQSTTPPPQYANQSYNPSANYLQQQQQYINYNAPQQMQQTTGYEAPKAPPQEQYQATNTTQATNATNTGVNANQDVNGKAVEEKVEQDEKGEEAQPGEKVINLSVYVSNEKFRLR